MQLPKQDEKSLLFFFFWVDPTKTPVKPFNFHPFQKSKKIITSHPLYDSFFFLNLTLKYCSTLYLELKRRAHGSVDGVSFLFEIWCVLSNLEVHDECSRVDGEVDHRREYVFSFGL